MHSLNRIAALADTPAIDPAQFPLTATLLREYDAIDRAVTEFDRSLQEAARSELRMALSRMEREVHEDILDHYFDGITALLAFGDLPDAQELAGDLFTRCSSTRFQLTKAFESDYAEYGLPARRDSAAADLIFAWHDLIAQTVSAGRLDEARQLANLI